MVQRTFLVCASLVIANCAVSIAVAQTGVDAVPSPDLSRLPVAQAESLRRARSTFDRSKDIVNGDASAENYALLGAAYARAGVYDAADVALADAALIAPNNANWLYMRGLLAAMQQKNDLAKSYIDRAFALNKDYVPIRTALANQRIASGDFEGARRLLEPYLSAHPDQPIIIATLADVAMKQQRYDDAANLYKRAIAILPGATALNGKLAEAYTGAGDRAAASAARAKTGPELPVLYDPVGQRLVGDNTSAASPRAGQPTDPRAVAISETGALLARAQYAEARQRLAAALKAAPNDPALLGLGARIELQSGNYAAAEARIAAMLTADPRNVEALTDRGLMLEMRGDDAAAERAYQQAIAANSSTAAAARIALGTLLVRVGRMDDAATQFRDAIMSDPANGEAWARSTAVQFVRGRCADAVKALAGNVQKSPGNVAVLTLLVRAASTCSAASDEDRRRMMDIAAKMYQSAGDTPRIAESYALSLAANGRWDDAIKTQEAAMFVSLRNRNTQGVVAYQQFLQSFRAHKLPDRPWPADAEMFKPKRPAPVPAPPAGTNMPARK